VLLTVFCREVRLVTLSKHSARVVDCSIACRRVIWAREAEAAAVPFREVSMHAISRDIDFYQKACIYCQLDKPEALQTADGGGADDEEGEEAVISSYDLLLVPEDDAAGAAMRDVVRRVAGVLNVHDVSRQH
jgi:Regulator of volume decrease after cellular swelling